MKKILSILMAALIPLALSCEHEQVEKETPRIVLKKKAAEIIEADNAFGFELFREVCAVSESENIMISPMSVSYALGMTYNGAAGTTLEAFKNVLHFDDLTKQEVNESYKDLMDQLLNLSGEVEFALANSIWYDENFNINPDFIRTNQDFFNAEVKGADFYDQATVDQINGWIEEQTNDRIRDMLDQIPPNTLMYLINAIYFNATWRYEFPKEDTYEGNFILEEGGIHRAEFMAMKGEFSYISNEEVAAVELPYSDSSFSMVVMLPGSGMDINDLTASLDAGRLQTWLEGAVRREVSITLPKFRYEFKDLLNEPLCALGLDVAFDPDDADFSGMVEGLDIWISRVIHQSFIDVQEEGTEAAAATIVEMTYRSAGGTTFRADRPFLYLIRENSTGAIVFIGKVGKPVYE